VPGSDRVQLGQGLEGSRHRRIVVLSAAVVSVVKSFLSAPIERLDLGAFIEMTHMPIFPRWVGHR
jgi:hypothetical protein